MKCVTVFYILHANCNIWCWEDDIFVSLVILLMKVGQLLLKAMKPINVNESYDRGMIGCNT